MNCALRFLRPFRYPGGKTWLTPYIRQWLQSTGSRPTEFIEPFAGGGSVGLMVAAQNLSEHVTLVERDEQVAAVWQTIIYGDWRWLAERIVTFDFTPLNVQTELAREPKNLAEKAFQTILRNRISHGGILAPGAGVLKKGEREHGWYSRWYPETLKDRISSIAQFRNRITFIEGDGLEVIQQHVAYAKMVFFIDPPYTADDKKAGSRLYRHHIIDHELLFVLASKLAGDFLMTYSDHQSVLSMTKMYAFATHRISMHNTHHSHMEEILIGRDLTWIPDS